MKKILSILFLFLLLQCKDPVEAKCQSACRFFVKCTEEVNRIKLTESELNVQSINCMKGCAKLQSEILSCYAEESDSCKGMAECIMQSGLGD